MFTFLAVLIIVVCALLAAFVLVQNSKGGGLAAGLSSSNQIMGVRKTSDFLEKATWTLAICLVVLSLAANFSLKSGGPSAGGESSIQEQINNAPVPAQPQAPAPTQQQPAAPQK